MNNHFTDERDSYGRLLVDREVWRQATTLAAAGELTARWLEGKSQYQAGTLAPSFDAETGISIKRGDTEATDVHSVKIVLERSDKLGIGYRIVTGYPTTP